MTELEEYRSRAAEVINEYVKTFGTDNVLHTSQIRKMLEEKIGYVYVMFQGSDMCYDKTNKANLKTYPEDILLFKSTERRGYYQVLGQNYPYIGDVMWKKRGLPDEVVGRWKDGQLDFYMGD